MGEVNQADGVRQAVDAAHAEAGGRSQGGSEDIAEQLVLLKEQQALQLRSLGDSIAASLGEAAGALGDIRQQLGGMSRKVRTHASSPFLPFSRWTFW